MREKPEWTLLSSPSLLIYCTSVQYFPTVLLAEIPNFAVFSSSPTSREDLRRMLLVHPLGKFSTLFGHLSKLVAHYVRALTSDLCRMEHSTQYFYRCHLSCTARWTWYLVAEYFIEDNPLLRLWWDLVRRV